MKYTLVPPADEYLEHPLIRGMTKAAKFTNPTVPRCGKQTIWDPAVVLDHLASFPHYRKLTNMQLSKKTVMLVAWHQQGGKWTFFLSLDSMVKSASQFTFMIKKASKNHSATYSDCQLFDIPRFPGRPEICAYTALSWYLHFTRNVRQTQQVFIVINGGTPAARPTLNRWLRNVFTVCKIDITVFTSFHQGSLDNAPRIQQGCYHLVPLCIQRCYLVK